MARSLAGPPQTVCILASRASACCCAPTRGPLPAALPLPVPRTQLVPVVARGLVLLVLVALRNVADGDLLLRDYGAAWRQHTPFADAWEHFQEEVQLDRRAMGRLLGIRMQKND